MHSLSQWHMVETQEPIKQETTVLFLFLLEKTYHTCVLLKIVRRNN